MLRRGWGSRPSRSTFPRSLVLLIQPPSNVLRLTLRLCMRARGDVFPRSVQIHIDRPLQVIIGCQPHFLYNTKVDIFADKSAEGLYNEGLRFAFRAWRF